MKEQLVSFETAKLAKEKEFNIIQRYGNNASLYDKYGNHSYYSNYGFMNSGLNDKYISAPTQALLQKWLREVKFIEVIIFPTNNNKYFFSVYYRSLCFGLIQKLKNLINILEFSEEATLTFESYEDALEAGLYKALLLI